MKIRVLHTVWGAEDEAFEGGEHEISSPSAAFLKLAAGAEAGGAIEILDETKAERAKLARAIESDEDSLAKQEKAIASGEWGVANRAQYELDLANGGLVAAVGGEE